MINVWPRARSIRTHFTRRVEEVSRVANCCRRCHLYTRAVTRSHTNPHHRRRDRSIVVAVVFVSGVGCAYTAYNIIIMYTSDDLNSR